jgi:hypothetical protein
MYEDYEKNLKDYLEVLKDDLKIILTSTIPTQKNLMKTLLWVNVTIMGFLIAIFSKDSQILLFLSIPFIFSSISIFLILKSLTDGRVKYFATPPFDDITKHLDQDFERQKGLISLISSLKTAFEKNTLIVKKRANKINYATKFTIFSAISIFFIIIFITNQAILHKEDVMGEEKKTPPTSLDSTKPEYQLATNNTASRKTEYYSKNESKKVGKKSKKEGK